MNYKTMKITYTTSPLSNPIMHNMQQWVANCQEFVLDDEISSMEELARMLEFWRSAYLTSEAEQIEVVLFSSECILIKDQSRGEYIQVDKVKEVSHA